LILTVGKHFDLVESLLDLESQLIEGDSEGLFLLKPKLDRFY